MKLFLAGGGSGDKSKQIDSAFVKTIKKRNPIFYIPLARNPPYGSCLDWITSSFARFGLKNFKMARSIKDLKNVKLKRYSAVYIGGGNTFKLLRDIKKIGFDKKLKTYLKKGGVCYGGSAGAIIFGKDIELAGVIDDKKRVRIRDLSGLDVLGGFSVYCHYEKKYEKKIKAYVKRNSAPVIALPENSGVIIEGKIMKPIGKGKPIVFLPKK